MKKLKGISKSQIAQKGVQALANRPNTSTQYGVGGLSSTQLKLWFDNLATLLAEKINEIQEVLCGGEATEYICAGENGESLKELIDAFGSGRFAEELLKLSPSASETEKRSLQTVINGIVRSLSETAESLEEGLTQIKALESGTVKKDFADKNYVMRSELSQTVRDISYDRRTQRLTFNYGDTEKTVDLFLEETVLDVEDRLGENGTPEVRIVFEKDGEGNVTAATEWYTLDTLVELKNYATREEVEAKQDVLPQNDSLSSAKIYVATPNAIKDENGNYSRGFELSEDKKEELGRETFTEPYYLKRLNTHRGNEGVVTRANRDEKLAAGLIGEEQYENYATLDEPTGITVAVRTDTGQLVVEDGTQDFCAVNKRQLDGKVSKMNNSTTGARAYVDYGYGTDGNLVGDGFMRCVTGSYTSGVQGDDCMSLARFTSKGTLLSNDATSNYEVVNRRTMTSYVGDKMSPLNANVDLLKKKVANLQAGVSEDLFVGEEKQAAVIEIPLNACPYAQLNRIGGYTEKSWTDISVTDSGTYEGVDVTVNSDESVTLNGTLTSGSYFDITRTDVAGGEKIYLGASAEELNKYPELCFQCHYTIYYDDGERYDNLATFSYSTDDDGYTYITVPDYCDSNIRIMANDGDVTFEELTLHFTTDIPGEIKNATVTSYKLIKTDIPDRTLSSQNGITVMHNSDGSMTFDGTATAATEFVVKTYTNKPKCIYVGGFKNTGSGSSPTMKITYYHNTTNARKIVKTLSAPQAITIPNMVSVSLYFSSGAVLNNCTVRPYVITTTSGTTMPIDSNILALEGYGQSVPNDPTQCNYIDFENKKFVRYGYMDGTKWVSSPLTVDISQYLPADNYIDVEGCAALFFNTPDITVPPVTDITFQLKGYTEDTEDEV